MTSDDATTARPSLATQLRAKRSELMLTEVAAVALALFHERGFSAVTVEDIAAEAHISVRTFYRYFPTKDDVLLVPIHRRADALRAALAARPLDEPPLHSLRAALTDVVADEDAMRIRRWMDVVAATPTVLRAVLGEIQLKTLGTITEFFATRMDESSDASAPTMLAAAAGGVIQAAHTQWYVHGGDLTARIAEGIEVLERGFTST